MSLLVSALTEAVWHFAPTPDQLPGARGAIRGWLDGLSVAPEVAGDAILVASELITNGVLHDGGGLITVRAAFGPGRINLEVHTMDHGDDQQPVWLQNLRDPFEGGFGMRIITALSSDFTVHSGEGRRTVWCSLPVPGQPGPDGS
jgi:anti-sigma regulatory factor (Ser/Thr protein kinase)